MAITTFAALNTQLYGGTQRLRYIKLGTTAVVSVGPHLNSMWPDVPYAGSTPTTAAVCDNTTTGGLASYGWANKIGTEQRLWLERYEATFPTIINSCALILVDRLAHVGGLDGTLLTAQSNGAWPALTRSTSGIGVWAAAEIYTSIGATATTLTVSYANQASGASTSQPIDFGGGSRNGARRLLPISLANADKGITAITSATLAASTGTAGNWGITLFKTYGVWYANNTGIPASHNGQPISFSGFVPAVPDNACLQFLVLAGANGAPVIGANVRAFED